MKWLFGLAGALVIAALVVLPTIVVSHDHGWGQNDRAWFDDVFWMELLTQCLGASLAAVVAVGLYRAGQRDERHKAAEAREDQRREADGRRRDQVAVDIMDVLHDLRPWVQAQTNEEELIPEAVTEIRDGAAQLSRIGSRLVGTPHAALPRQISRDIASWLLYAGWRKDSPNRPPDLIQHAYYLEEYVGEAEIEVGAWRNEGKHNLPESPSWVALAKQRRSEEAQRREERRSRIHADVDQEKPADL